MRTAEWRKRRPSVAVEARSQRRGVTITADGLGLAGPLFEMNLQAMCVVDRRTFRVLEANHSAAAMFKYRKSEMIALSLFDLCDQAEHERLFALGAGITSGREYSGVWKQRRKDGGAIRVRASWKSGIGFGDAMLWTFEDQTALQGARDAGALMATLFADSPHGICRYRLSSRRVVETNRAILAACGLDSADQAKICEPYALEQRFLRSSEADGFSRALNVAQAFERQAQWNGYDGVVRTVRIYGYPMRADAEERFLQIEDITTAREMAQADEQREKMESLGRVAATVAHDFNNILLVMRGYAEMLQRALPATSLEGRHAAALLAAADSAAETTAALVGFSRKEEELPAPLDLNEVVREVAGRFFPTLPDRISGRLTIADESMPVVAKRSELKRMLLNLAANARDAMPGGGQLSVGTCARQNCVTQRAEVCVEIADTGTGMDEATRARIFERFFTTKAAGRGTGLGLAFVVSCMTQLGGRVEVESALGKGSCFRLVFPADGVHAVLREKLPESALRKTATILLVDDDEQIRTLVGQFLTMLRHEVVIADGAADALRMLSDGAHGIDLLMTDIAMPEMSGEVLAERVRAQAPSVRILLMSGRADVSSLTDAGFGVLLKPFSLGEMQEQLEKALG